MDFDYVDSYLLALDRDTGAPLGARGFDEVAWGFTNRGNLILYKLDDEGFPLVQIKSIRLIRS